MEENKAKLYINGKEEERSVYHLNYLGDYIQYKGRIIRLSLIDNQLTNAQDYALRQVAKLISSGELGTLFDKYLSDTQLAFKTEQDIINFFKGE